jgi:hypothetical protein
MDIDKYIYFIKYYDELISSAFSQDDFYALCNMKLKYTKAVLNLSKVKCINEANTIILEMTFNSLKKKQSISNKQKGVQAFCDTVELCLLDGDLESLKHHQHPFKN